MPEKREVQEEMSDPNAWMATFSDLLLLMLTFFVLLLTMSSLDSQKLAEVARPGTLLDDTGGAMQSGEVMMMTTKREISPDFIPPHTPPQYVARIPASLSNVEEAQEELFTNMGMNGKGWLERKPQRLSVHLHGDALFVEGSLIMTQIADQYLKESAALFAQNPSAELLVEVWVEGGEGLLEREAALRLALARGELLARRFVAYGVQERRIVLGAYEASAGVRQQRFLRQKELVSFTLEQKP